MKQPILSMTMIIVLLLACSPKPDADRVRDMIQRGAALAEKQHIGDLLDMASKDFIARPGNHNARSVKGVLFATFRHYGQFKIYYPRPTIEMTSDGRGASATVYFMMVRREITIPGLKELVDNPRRWIDAVGEKADLYQLKLQMKKIEGDWFVQEAQLEGFQGFAG